MATETTVLPELSFDYLGAAKNSKDILADMSDSEIEDVAVRYRKFLLLKAKYPEQAVAPTELIDAMWHLHMLHPVSYAGDCIALFGFILDHKPGVGATPETRPTLLKLFNRTAALWEAEFGEPYCVTGMRFHNVIICAEDDNEEEDKKKPQPPKPPQPTPPSRFIG